MATLTMLTSRTDMNIPVIKTASGTTQFVASGVVAGVGVGGCRARGSNDCRASDRRGHVVTRGGS
jgi:hypothetical protein